MCYHVKFVLSASKGVCINITEPKNWGAQADSDSLRHGVADTEKYTPPPRVLSCRTWVRVRVRVHIYGQGYLLTWPINILPQIQFLKLLSTFCNSSTKYQYPQIQAISRLPRPLLWSNNQNVESRCNWSPFLRYQNFSLPGIFAPRSESSQWEPSFLV